MSKRSKRAAAVTASVLALALTLAGTALASKTKIFPTVSLNASQSGHKVAASGTYDRVSTKCHGPGGRTVSLSANNGDSATTSTNGAGNYGVVKFGHFKFNHTYTIRAFVPGGVKSGYGDTTICYDASASTSVHFHS